jgi:hypothetical protein
MHATYTLYGSRGSDIDDDNKGRLPGILEKSKERTSSSLSGPHFGHYKGAMYKDTVSEMHAVFMDIALDLGYSPTHWQ